MPTQANPAALRQAASQFSAAAEALQTKVVELDTAVSSLVPNGWRGPGAQAFLHTWEHVRQDAQQATKALLQTASALQSLAAKLESAASHKWWKIALGTGLVLASGALLFVDVVQGGVNVATDAATAGTAEEAGAVLASAAADAAVADAAAASEFDYIGTLAQKVATYLARSLPTMGKMALINVGQTAGMQLLGTGNVNPKGLFDSAAMGFIPLPGLGNAAEAVQLTEEGAAVENTAQNAVDAVPIEAGTAKGTGEVKGPYSHLDNPSDVGPGKDFTAKQKQTIIEENRKMNGGVVKSDQSGQVLTKPQKSTKGVTPDPNEWQIDHINPRSKGGSNTYSNAQVLSRAENRAKSDK